MVQANVLVVEDDDATRALLVEYLRHRGVLEVEGARDGVEALHRLSTRPFKVVILDVMMPHMSGIDLLHSLEAIAKDPSLKGPAEPPAIVIITGAPHETLDEAALAQRFPNLIRGVMRKPFDFAQLAGTVETLVSS